MKEKHDLNKLIEAAEKEYPATDCYSSFASLEETIETLKAERFARWQSVMTDDEKRQIFSAHNRAIAVLREVQNLLDTKKQQDGAILQIQKTQFNLADKVKIGDVVITGTPVAILDIGWVAKIDEANQPLDIKARPYTEGGSEPRSYGGVKYHYWYHTGVNIPYEEWEHIATVRKDAMGFHQYWESQLLK